jgi:organic hydroperoxide reductase OsmC/OhrA
MSQHTARLSWARRGAEFALKTYRRDHEAMFDGGVTIPMSAAAGPAVPAGTVGEHTVDPEELTVAAVASCHMLFFLALPPSAASPSTPTTTTRSACSRARTA